MGGVEEEEVVEGVEEEEVMEGVEEEEDEEEEEEEDEAEVVGRSIVSSWLVMRLTTETE